MKPRVRSRVARTAVVGVCGMSVLGVGCAGSTPKGGGADGRRAHFRDRAESICIAVNRRTGQLLFEGLTLTRVLRATAEVRHEALDQLRAVRAPRDVANHYARMVDAMAARQRAAEGYVVARQDEDISRQKAAIRTSNEDLEAARAAAAKAGLADCPFL